MFWYAFFWLYMITSLSLSIPLFFMRIFRMRAAEKRYLSFHTRLWGRSIIRAAGGKVGITGLKNIPRNKPVCFVSNHQSSLDIPLIMGYVYSVGFIAKKELRYLPIVNMWMNVLHCIFINRKSARESLEAVNKGAEYIKQGYPILIFPEGTRSRSNRMAPFKSGSLKLAVRSKSLIIPVTINGSYQLREERKGIITPAKIQVTIHPPIDSAALGGEDTKELAARLWNTIHSALDTK